MNSLYDDGWMDEDLAGRKIRKKCFDLINTQIITKKFDCKHQNVNTSECQACGKWTSGIM